MSLSLSYLDDLSRVRITGSALTGSALVESSTDEIRWTVVRGGQDIELDAGGFTLDDYEFGAGVETFYRVTDDVATESDSITVVLEQPWLKSVTRTFLNRPVTLYEFGPVERPTRGGLFDVVGRSFPVAVTDVRGSRRQELTLLTETPTEAKELDFVVAAGDVMFWHAPPDCPVPSRHIVVGDTGEARTPFRYTQRRVFTLPTTEVAVPAPSVVGVTATWDALINDYGSWSAVVAAFPDWQAVLDYVGDPESVIVP